MAEKITLPQVSANVETETITHWYKSEGDCVEKGEALFEVTTDKAAVEVEAPRSGRLRKVLAEEKSILPVGYVVALVGDEDEALPDVAEDNRGLIDRQRREIAAAGPSDRGKRRRARGGRRVRATPAARRAAREHGVDLNDIAAVTEAAVVGERDVKDFLERRDS